MSVFGITMVKDEADIIAATVTRMAEQCDEVLVIDNGSTDGTRDLLDNLPCRVFDDPEPAYWQSEKITRLAHTAGDMGATWVVPFDADEVWTSHRGRLAVLLPQLDCHVARGTWTDHIPTAADPDCDPVTRMGWRRRAPNRLGKVAARVEPSLTIAMGNHDATYDRRVAHQMVLRIRHYPVRSPEQFCSKITNGWAALKATDLPENQGHLWRRWGRILDTEGPDGLRTVYFAEHYSSAPSTDPTLTFDPA